MAGAPQAEADAFVALYAEDACLCRPFRQGSIGPGFFDDLFHRALRLGLAACQKGLMDACRPDMEQGKRPPDPYRRYFFGLEWCRGTGDRALESYFVPYMRSPASPSPGTM